MKRRWIFEDRERVRRRGNTVYNTYKYRSVCPFVQIGSPPPLLPSECGGGHLLAWEGARGANSGRLEKKPGTLYTMWRQGSNWDRSIPSRREPESPGWLVWVKDWQFSILKASMIMQGREKGRSRLTEAKCTMHNAQCTKDRGGVVHGIVDPDFRSRST
jgi:hypothetical protein